MSPTSYRTAPPRVTDRNTHRNTTPDRRSSASGARLQAMPHDLGRELPCQAVATRRSLRIGTASSVSNANALSATMLEAAHRHLVQPALENRARAVAFERGPPADQRGVRKQQMRKTE